MPIDARIPLGAEAPQISPLNSYLRMMQIQEQQAQAQDRALERRERLSDRALERRERLSAINDRDRVREVLGGPGGLTEDKVNQIFGIDPETGLRLRQHLTQMTREERLAAQEKAEDAARILVGVRDQAGYDNALRVLGASGHDVSGFSKQFDPAIVDGYVKRGMTLSQLISLSSKQEEKPVPVETTDAQGNPVTKYVVPKAGDVYAKPKKAETDNEPLVEVDENGTPVYKRRSDAVNKKAYHPPTRAAAGKPEISSAQRAVAERTKFNELQKIEESFRNGDITPQEREAAKLQVQNSYLAQMGEEPVAALDASWDFAGRGGKPAAAAAAKGPAVKAGQMVTLKNGTRVKVTKVNTDGSYEGTPVQ